MNLPRWALRNPVTAGMVVLSVFVLGALSVPRLPLAFLPEVDFPQVEVRIPYPNALPAQVEEEIARPAEEALATLSGVRRISSYSSSNEAVIWMEFAWGVDIGPLRAEAREKLDRIRDRLPADEDGPSAGITICAAMTSALTRVPVRHDLATTGEITLRGRVLPIGGLKETALAAHRAGIVRLIIPKENAKDLKELPAHVRKALTFTLAETMDEVLREALVRYDFGEAGARREYDLEELLAGAPPREATAH